jgi:hypothetical protein
MTTQTIQKIFQRFQKASPTQRQKYFRIFEKKMIYRTTKTENPETTPALVRRVLGEIS